MFLGGWPFQFLGGLFWLEFLYFEKSFSILETSKNKSTPYTTVAANAKKAVATRTPLALSRRKSLSGIMEVIFDLNP